MLESLYVSKTFPITEGMEAMVTDRHTERETVPQGKERHGEKERESEGGGRVISMWAWLRTVNQWWL